jgi:two-component system phosphate regulon sensor histidine kinase PhoR
VSFAGYFILKELNETYIDEITKRVYMNLDYLDYFIDNNPNITINTSLENIMSSYNEYISKNQKDNDIDFFIYEPETAFNYINQNTHLNNEVIDVDLLNLSNWQNIQIINSKTKTVLLAYKFNENINAVITASISKKQTIYYFYYILFFIVLSTALSIILIFVVEFYYSRKVTTPIFELIEASKLVSEGNYKIKANRKSEGVIKNSAETFNNMTNIIDKTVTALKNENIKVESIMNSMINGIVALDKSYNIILINTRACELFDIEYSSEIIGKNLIEVIRNSQINGFIKETILDNISLINEIAIGAPHNMTLRVYTNPIKSTVENELNSGGIIFMHDISDIRKLEKMRSEFVSNVTHELKTPLTSIKGFIETLRNGAIENKTVANKFLEIIDIESDRLYTLINDILHLSEIETIKMDQDITTCNLNNIIESVIAFLKGTAEKKQITIINSTTEQLYLHVNRDRIKQMLINLVDNAIKYNIKEGTIIINAYKDEGTVVISVKDTGIGIPEKYFDRIFERFYRVDKGRSRNAGGTGLGLSIVKHIINLYNGDIKVISKANSGTEFIIKLPLI